MERGKPSEASSIDTEESLDPISRGAITWFVRLLNNNADQAQRAAFELWLAADERHADAYAEVERFWAGAATLPDLALVGSERRREGNRIGPSGLRRRSFVRGPLAAGLGMILLVAIWALAPSHPFADYRTSKGETRTIRLADGSTVELSTNTALSLGFNERTRRVSLLSGTAFFQVAPDRTRPFMVDAAGGETTALGTAFAVGRNNDDGVQVIDTEHSVSVRVVKKMIHLSAGEQITYRNGHLETPERCDSATALAWRDGHLVFLSARFAQVIDALNQWLPGRMILMDRSLADRRVTVIVDVRHSHDVIDALTHTLPVRAVSLTRYLTLIYSATRPT